MRTLKDLAVPKNTDAKFPFHAIQNETDTQDGTPIVEEIYGDLLTNIYKLLQSVGITPTNTQDSDTSQYQILQALKQLPNNLNDVERILNLSGSIWSVDLNLDFLPNRYFFVARASENYDPGISYGFKGSTTTQYNFASSGFSAGDELLVIIDVSVVRAYSLSFLSNAPQEVFASLGVPISFNDSNKMWYEEDGNLISDEPTLNMLQATIRFNLSDGTILVHNMFVMNGFVLCFCVVPATNDYFFRQFTTTDFTVSYPVNIVGTSFSNAIDFSPYVYASNGVVYVTNAMNTTSADNSFTKLNFTSRTLTSVSIIPLFDSFVKTSNAAIKNGLLYTMISGNLKSYNLVDGNTVSLGIFTGIVGQIFSFNGNVYFNSGEVCKLWF